MADCPSPAQAGQDAKDPLLRVERLCKDFPLARGGKGAAVRAVSDVSFSILPWETLGLVGESGCGKSTTGRLLLRIIEPTSGRIFFQGKTLYPPGAGEEESLRILHRDFRMIFQDPFSSLNPRMSVEDLITEPMAIAGCGREERRGRARELLTMVGLAEYHATRYPHEFSGGQRQRIGIARALAMNPKFIVCDEPVSALDVSVQAQIVNLLKDLQEQLELTYLFISHDLSVVHHISDRVAVMYLGKLVEMGSKSDLFAGPLHPYTEALLSAIPDPSRQRQRIVLTGELPSPVNPPSGCRFHTRCRKKMAVCEQEEPRWKEMGDGHGVACHLYPA